MKRQLRFLHAADLHLGAPFRGFRALSDAWADRLTRAIPEAYERVIETAITERVDFVVIAGDVFDSGRPSYANFLQFFRGIERLRDVGIPVYFCTGNHDPATSWKQNMFAMPDNAVMFSADKPSFILHERDGEPLCILAGRGYPFKVWSREQNIAEGMTRRAAERALDAGGRT